VTGWRIEDVRRVTVRGSDSHAAFVIHTEGEADGVAQIVVEYARGGLQIDSVGHARRVATAYIDDPTPPRRLLVDREGKMAGARTVLKPGRPGYPRGSVSSATSAASPVFRTSS
jgi:hypothetical protein